MSAEWHYARDGHQYGPFTEDEFKRLANNRGLQPDDLVWRDGMADWMPVSSLHGLFTSPSPDRRKPCPFCGELIAESAIKCRFCGSMLVPIDGAAVRASHNPNAIGTGIKVCILLSGIADILIGIIWVGTCFGAVWGIPQIVLGVFEVVFFAQSDTMPRQTAIRRAKLLGCLEIVSGLFNPISLVCGILVLSFTARE